MTNNWKRETFYSSDQTVICPETRSKRDLRGHPALVRTVCRRTFRPMQRQKVRADAEKSEPPKRRRVDRNRVSLSDREQTPIQEVGHHYNIKTLSYYVLFWKWSAVCRVVYFCKPGFLNWDKWSTPCSRIVNMTLSRELEVNLLLRFLKAGSTQTQINVGLNTKTFVK